MKILGIIAMLPMVLIFISAWHSFEDERRIAWKTKFFVMAIILILVGLFTWGLNQWL